MLLLEGPKVWVPALVERMVTLRRSKRTQTNRLIRVYSGYITLCLIPVIMHIVYSRQANLVHKKYTLQIVNKLDALKFMINLGSVWEKSV